jgi:hypothetical protein
LLACNCRSRRGNRGSCQRGAAPLASRHECVSLGGGRGTRQTLAEQRRGSCRAIARRNKPKLAQRTFLSRGRPGTTRPARGGPGHGNGGACPRSRLHPFTATVPAYQATIRPIGRNASASTMARARPGCRRYERPVICAPAGLLWVNRVVSSQAEVLPRYLNDRTFSTVAGSFMQCQNRTSTNGCATAHTECRPRLTRGSSRFADGPGDRSIPSPSLLPRSLPPGVSY